MSEAGAEETDQMARFTDHADLLDSLALFDRPETERLRDFLPRGADVNQLVDELFAPIERSSRSSS